MSEKLYEEKNISERDKEYNEECPLKEIDEDMFEENLPDINEFNKENRIVEEED